MARRVQIVRHDAAAAQTFEGRDGEITVDRTNVSLRVHDGITPGGVEQARADLNNVQTASAGTHGKMSAQQASNLVQALADIITNATDIATLTTGKANKVVPSAAGNVAALTAGGDLQDSGKSFTSTDDKIDNFPAGTSLIFPQATAPLGWTKSTVHNNKALRIVDSSGGGSGGIHDLSNPPNLDHTHTTAAHQHTLPIGTDAGSTLLAYKSQVSGTFVSTKSVGTSGGGSATQLQFISDAAGAGSTGSTTPTAFAPKFVDGIICIKD